MILMCVCVNVELKDNFMQSFVKTFSYSKNQTRGGDGFVIELVGACVESTVCRAGCSLSLNEVSKK